ncbi:metal ABC transporter ATP-binding protein [Merismopedia glauca]|uniref:ABC transporter n=1 Tax=Merismopedia glauca CCAP 1448/3 TaxID=1296344 RepID=A0A2T1C3K3_9CYAN|nr:metal ABC transporter ATP-binding protein [Merismopedia glauca]PSB02852.1 ABC transporter [Merismopedia glauca CCAP 1448/3]
MADTLTIQPKISKPALLEVKNLSCGYQNQPVFTNVNLSFPPGNMCGLVGPSGGGKSTLMKTILGLIPPWSGEVLFQGKQLKKGQSPPKVGYVPQVETVDWNFPVTAYEVVLMGRYRQRKLFSRPSKRDRRLVKEILERLNIAHVAHQSIGELSGGQQQRVFLARALVGEPDLVILDEPTSSSDLRMQHELLHLLGELNQQGLTILLSTHDLNSVASHLPWVICFNRGVVCQGEPINVFNPSNLEKTFGAEMIVVHQGDRILIASGQTSRLHQTLNQVPTSIWGSDSHL